MSFDEFAEWVKRVSGERPADIRLGQYAFNTLCVSHPEIANKYRGTQYDPFHVDELLPRFMAIVLIQNVIVSRGGRA